MAKWTIDLSKYADAQNDKIIRVRKGFLFALYSSITQRNPVDTGRSRANWNVSAYNEDASTNWEARQIKYNSVDEMPDTKGDEPLFIANGLPYVEGLEYGKSKQAPNGMVGVTVAGSKEILENVIRGIE